MLKERITKDSIFAALRNRKIDSLAEAGAVILENDRSLAVLSHIENPDNLSKKILNNQNSNFNCTSTFFFEVEFSVFKLESEIPKSRTEFFISSW